MGKLFVRFFRSLHEVFQPPTLRAGELVLDETNHVFEGTGSDDAWRRPVLVVVWDDEGAE